MVEYSSSLEPPVMVARGVLHGCIGVCCTAKYPSVFANIGDKDIWNFVQEKAIKINVDNQNEDPNRIEGDETIELDNIYVSRTKKTICKVTKFST